MVAILRGVTAVFHAAAKVDDRSALAPCAEVTAGGTRSMAEAAVKCGVGRFVRISLSSVYEHLPGRDTIIDDPTPLDTVLQTSCHNGRAKIDAILRGRLKIVGARENRLNVVDATNAAGAANLASRTDRAVGQVYHVTCDAYMTQRPYFNLIAQGMDAPEVTTKVPYRVAYSPAILQESVCRLLRTTKPPYFTRHGINS